MAEWKKDGASWVRDEWGVASNYYAGAVIQRGAMFSYVARDTSGDILSTGRAHTDKAAMAECDAEIDRMYPTAAAAPETEMSGFAVVAADAPPMFTDDEREQLGLAAYGSAPRFAPWESLYPRVREEYRVQGEAVARVALRLVEQRK